MEQGFFAEGKRRKAKVGKNGKFFTGSHCKWGLPAPSKGWWSSFDQSSHPPYHGSPPASRSRSHQSARCVALCAERARNVGHFAEIGAISCRVAVPRCTFCNPLPRSPLATYAPRSPISPPISSPSNTTPDPLDLPSPHHHSISTYHNQHHKPPPPPPSLPSGRGPHDLAGPASWGGSCGPPYITSLTRAQPHEGAQGAQR